jgi:site-specific DNA-methyltransferase (adenine-specific)
MEFMADVPDNYYELAIVDPPYGIRDFQTSRNTPGRGVQRFERERNGLFWDKKPNNKYFEELFRTSKEQIIWGGNNFKLPLSEYFVIWDKQQTVENFASAEFAWVSMNKWKKPSKVFRYSIHYLNKKKNKIHPTQKPVALYKWLLKNYAKPGDKIFDSHVGSGSIRIACHDLGFDFEGCEIDEDYWNAQEERYKNHVAQQELFSFNGGHIEEE